MPIEWPFLRIFAAMICCLASAACGRSIVWNGRRSLGSHPTRAPADFLAPSLALVLRHGQPQIQLSDGHCLVAYRRIAATELKGRTPIIGIAMAISKVMTGDLRFLRASARTSTM